MLSCPALFRRGRRLPQNRHDARHLQRTAARNELLDGLTLNVFLGDEMDAVDAAHFVDLHDVGMHQGRSRPGFVVETPDVVMLGGQFATQHFDRHLPLQRFLLRR